MVELAPGTKVTVRSPNIKVGVAAPPITTNLRMVGSPGPQGPTGPQGDPGVVQSIVAGANVTVDSTDPTNPVVSSAAGVTDHGALTGLADDDHTQYHNDVRGDTRYYTKSQVDTSLAGKADTSHSHAAGDVTSGTFPVSRGGTGVGTLTSGNVLVGAGINAVATTKAAPSGAFVGTTDTQTLTNKTLGSGTNASALIQSGTVNVTVSAATLGTAVVTFPTAFATTPKVVLTSVSSLFWPYISVAPTTTEVTVGVREYQAASRTDTITVHWIATTA